VRCVMTPSASTPEAGAVFPETAFSPVKKEGRHFLNPVRSA
jgi:hypothetical protein